MADIQESIANKLIEAARVVEDQLDSQIEKIEKLDLDDLDQIRENRLRALKKQEKQKQEWASLGHGDYTELQDEKDFFTSSQNSANMVCHFYTHSSERCKLVDKHLAILAKKHHETRFCKMDAEKTPFLVERLAVKMMPTIILVKDGITRPMISGFDQLGGIDTFPTEMLEWRIAKAQCIKYSGDLENPPIATKSKRKVINYAPKKSIKDDNKDESEDENDW